MKTHTFFQIIKTEQRDRTIRAVRLTCSQAKREGAKGNVCFKSHSLAERVRIGRGSCQINGERFYLSPTGWGETL